MTDQLTVEIQELKKLETDSRGRANLGTDYKNATVRVAIVEVVDEADD